MGVLAEVLTGPPAVAGDHAAPADRRLQGHQPGGLEERRQDVGAVPGEHRGQGVLGQLGHERDRRVRFAAAAVGVVPVVGVVRSDDRQRHAAVGEGTDQRQLVLEGLDAADHDDAYLSDKSGSPLTARLLREALARIEALQAENDGLRAARIAYASEFPLNEEGDPDVGSIHQNIRALKAELAQAKRDAERYRWLEARFTGYDFNWNAQSDDADDGKVVAVFNVGPGFRGGRDVTAAIDAAMQAQKESGNV